MQACSAPAKHTLHEIMSSGSPDNPSFLRAALVVGPDPEVACVVANPPGWKIKRADNNPAALQLIAEQPFDLVTTGENSSGKADVELLRQIRLLRPDTRLILLTNESNPAS